jgi:Ulp1 family protease
MNTKKLPKDELFEALKKYEGKSMQIRYMDSIGYSRTDIKDLLSEYYGKEIRYQHVRNVLVTIVKKAI